MRLHLNLRWSNVGEIRYAAGIPSEERIRIVEGYNQLLFKTEQDATKIDNFLYLTRHFEDMDAEHYIKMNTGIDLSKVVNDFRETRVLSEEQIVSLKVWVIKYIFYIYLQELVAFTFDTRLIPEDC